MKKQNVVKVPVLERAFELNLPKLMRTANATGASKLILDDGDVRTVALLTQNRLAVFLGGRTWLADIVPVPCLKDRVRPCFKCPHAHEGNFQSLYWSGDELACRFCLKLRYSSNLAATATDRARIARQKLLVQLGGRPGADAPARKAGKWRRKHRRLVGSLAGASGMHYAALRTWLQGVGQQGEK